MMRDFVLMVANVKYHKENIGIREKDLNTKKEKLELFAPYLSYFIVEHEDS
jgi:hypothetical protein